MDNAITDIPGRSTPAPGAGKDFFSWIRSHERGVLIGAVVLQMGVLGAMLLMRASIVLYGQTVRLRVIPVDPRDLFRGDYVILSYDFSRPSGRIQGLSSIWAGEHRGKTVYVSLEREGGGSDSQYWYTSYMSLNRPQAGTVFLQGKLNEWGQVECGIESFFVQEGKGREYETAVREKRLSAEIAVTPDGRAALKRLHID